MAVAAPEKAPSRLMAPGRAGAEQSGTFLARPATIGLASRALPPADAPEIRLPCFAKFKPAGRQSMVGLIGSSAAARLILHAAALNAPMCGMNA